MKLSFLAAAAAAFVFATPALSQTMTTQRSASDFAVTKTKLVEAVKARGFSIVAEVDHAGAAKANDLALRPTHLIIFGNPKGGTPLMACAQTVGLDLPLKALVWQGEDGATNISVNLPTLLGDRHGVASCGAGPLANMGKAIDAIMADAVKP